MGFPLRLWACDLERVIYQLIWVRVVRLSAGGLDAEKSGETRCADAQKPATRALITVSMSSLFIQFVPVVVLTEDPIINALFGGVVMGLGIGFALRHNISSGGTDIVSLTIRKKTGRNVGSISFLVNGTIMLIAGLTFGWKYALYSMITIFVSSRVTDAVFTKQKRMQAMIVTSNPDAVIEKIHNKLHRGATMIHDAEGTYNHERKAVLITVITRAEFNDFTKVQIQIR